MSADGKKAERKLVTDTRVSGKMARRTGKESVN
jgi:hypothetical protein